MNETEIRKLIIDHILIRIPSYIKPVDYISETLDIGKESAYRRLRGEMSFTFDEIIKLSLELNFSIDDIIGGSSEKRAFVDIEVDKDPEQNVILRLQSYKKDAERRLEDPFSSAIMAINFLPTTFCVHFPVLFKFSYYSWLHRKYRRPSRLYLSEVQILPIMESLRKKLDVLYRKISNNTFIFDPNVFLSPIREVHYFYELGLITNDEVKMIKSDFHKLIDLIEKMVRTGESAPGSQFYFYLSNLNIDSNSSYNTWNNNVTSTFNFHFLSPIVVNNSILCELHKEWLESLKKYSTLITQSNEIIQAEYFERQREYVDRLDDKKFYF